MYLYIYCTVLHKWGSGMVPESGADGIIGNQLPAPPPVVRKGLRWCVRFTASSETCRCRCGKISVPGLQESASSFYLIEVENLTRQRKSTSRITWLEKELWEIFPLRMNPISGRSPAMP